MKRRSTTLGTIRRLIKEEMVAPAAGPNLGKLLDDVSSTFVAKMTSQFPGAEEAIKKEAADLKTQLVAQIKASAAKVKMSASKPS